MGEGAKRVDRVEPGEVGDEAEAAEGCRHERKAEEGDQALAVTANQQGCDDYSEREAEGGGCEDVDGVGGVYEEDGLDVARRQGLDNYRAVPARTATKTIVATAGWRANHLIVER